MPGLLPVALNIGALCRPSGMGVDMTSAETPYEDRVRHRPMRLGDLSARRRIFGVSVTLDHVNIEHPPGPGLGPQVPWL